MIKLTHSIDYLSTSALPLQMGTFTFCGSSRSKEICNKNPMTTICRRREQSPPYERGDTMDEADANVIGLTEKPDYNKEVSVLTDEEQNRIKSEVCTITTLRK